MAETAGQSADLDRDKLLSAVARLGRLCFDDFRRLEAPTTRRVLSAPETADLWPLALNNTPAVLLHFRRSTGVSSFIVHRSSLAEVASAQSRLVHAFALHLLKVKAPPLYDALPWHDWDFSIVARRFKLWQTRILLAGDGSSVTMCRCRRSAGVYVLEPHQTIARYVERKGELEKVKRLRVLRASLDKIPLADHSVDLAIIGSTLDSAAPHELSRVAADVLVVENNPLLSPLEEQPFLNSGFTPNTVEVRSLGPRRSWWKAGRA